MTEKGARLYLSLIDEEITVRKDGTIEVTLEAFVDDRRYPVTVTLNLGDDVEQVEKFFNRIILIMKAVGGW